MKKFCIIGGPFGYLANENGCGEAPDFLRQNGLHSKIKQRTNDAWKREIEDLGNVEVSEEVLDILKSNKVLGLKKYCELLSEKVVNSYSKAYTPIIIGGDHSISVGTLMATSKYLNSQGKKLGVLWIDAHADLNDNEKGNIHGKSVAIALGEVYQETFDFNEKNRLVHPENIVYLGIRDMMPNELKLIEKYNIDLYGMDKIDEVGIRLLIKDIVEKLENETDGFFVSFDIDVCEGSIFNGCGTPEIGGLTAREAIQIAYEVGKSDKFIGADIVEFSPSRDINGNTNTLVIKIIEALWGFRM